MSNPQHIAVGLAVLTMAAMAPHQSRAARDAAAGRVLLEQNCARCHSIAATGDSPLAQAPPLRQVYLKFPIQELESGFAEGMGSRHKNMPQIQFTSEQVQAILDYLGEISGEPPESRKRFAIPGETPP